MKAKPILFTGENVRAILDGRKTMTRRVIKNAADLVQDCDAHDKNWGPFYFDEYGDSHLTVDRCPYGGPGDLLSKPPTAAGWYDVKWEPGDEWCRVWLFDGGNCWGHGPHDDPEAVNLDIRDPELTIWSTPASLLYVRETWRVGAWAEDQCVAVDYRADESARREWLEVPDEEMFERLWIQSTDDAIKAGIETDPDGNYGWEAGHGPCRWRPSIFMPRWASRLTLRVSSVRVERVQEISVTDAEAEGTERVPMWAARTLIAFSEMWDSINAKRPGCAWTDNPWCWVIEWDKVWQQNVDEVMKAL